MQLLFEIVQTPLQFFPLCCRDVLALTRTPLRPAQRLLDVRLQALELDPYAVNGCGQLCDPTFRLRMRGGELPKTIVQLLHPCIHREVSLALLTHERRRILVDPSEIHLCCTASQAASQQQTSPYTR